MVTLGTVEYPMLTLMFPCCAWDALSLKSVLLKLLKHNRVSLNCWFVRFTSWLYMMPHNERQSNDCCVPKLAPGMANESSGSRYCSERNSSLVINSSVFVQWLIIASLTRSYSVGYKGDPQEYWSRTAQYRHEYFSYTVTCYCSWLYSWL